MIKVNVSIIIVSYNTKDQTRNCIQSILNKTEGISYEIIVVDNASTDGSCEMIRSDFPQVKLIANLHNKGFGAANNQAIKLAQGDYLFLLNPDTLLTNNAIKTFYDFMEHPENHNAWCCGGQLFDRNMKPDISYSNFPSLTQIVFEFGLHKLFPNFYRQRLSVGVSCTGTENKPFQVATISGADMFIRRTLLDKIGLFDEDFFLYYEETELAWRAKQAGFNSVLLPDVHIIHLGGQSTSSLNLKKIEIFEASRFLFFKKCYGKKTTIIVRWLYIGWHLLRYLIHHNPMHIENIKIIWRVT